MSRAHRRPGLVSKGNPVGLLVFARTTTPLPEQPEGNYFPDVRELSMLLDAVGLHTVDQAELASFADPPVQWQDEVDRVDAVVQRDDAHDERLRTAQQQEQVIGRLLSEGLVAGSLLACRAT